ncbi:MAG: hypothetical protein ACYTGV_16440, partial [Planctomycetota bacterium]
MRMRERGIGNLPFIGVLVLFVVAVALWFVAKDQADTFKQKNVDLAKSVNDSNTKVVALEDSYNELVDVFGVEAADLVAKDQIAAKKEVIRKKVRDYLNER